MLSPVTEWQQKGGISHESHRSQRKPEEEMEYGHAP
jgi:hypothetical protein